MGDSKSLSQLASLTSQLHGLLDIHFIIHSFVVAYTYEAVGLEVVNTLDYEGHPRLVLYTVKYMI